MSGTIPDPSTVTMAVILRETSTLRELFDTRIDGLTAELTAKLLGLEKAQLKFEDTITHVPTDVDKSIGQLKSLHSEKFVGMTELINEKFAGVMTQFTQRDVALAAALQAAGNAVAAQNLSNGLSIDKMERNFVKLIDQLQALIEAKTKSLDEKNDDLKVRITAFESRAKGVGDGWGYLVGAVGLVTALVSIAIALSKWVK